MYQYEEYIKCEFDDIERQTERNTSHHKECPLSELK